MIPWILTRYQVPISTFHVYCFSLFLQSSWCDSITVLFLLRGKLRQRVIELLNNKNLPEVYKEAYITQDCFFFNFWCPDRMPWEANCVKWFFFLNKFEKLVLGTGVPQSSCILCSQMVRIWQFFWYSMR